MRTSSARDWKVGDIGYTDKTEHTVKITDIIGNRMLKVKYLCGCSKEEHEKMVFIPAHGELYKNTK
uniref:Uncharacterized protein n=1 Tax=viral metagenome TaxID=1070528 RepID=A0A6M3LGI3_9ZZZZ